MSGLAVYALWRREILRFVRQPSRVLSALGTPLIVWLLIGTGLSASFRMPDGPEGISFLEYFFPGILVLLVLFASIFSNISVIEDRHEGFLQAVLVAPVATVSLVMGKVLGSTSLSWLQGLLFLLLAPVAGLALDWPTFLAAAGVLVVLALGLNALGFAMAWRVDSTQGFHGVMNLLLIPMWMLSGAFFPIGGAPNWLTAVMRLNPLTYGVAALRRVLYPAGTDLGMMPALGQSLLVLVLGAGLAIGVALLATRRRP
jgi:daunorubicin resistance ABC transporter membrane protein